MLGAIIYGGPDGLEIHGRKTADGLLAAIKDNSAAHPPVRFRAGSGPRLQFPGGGDASRDAALINGDKDPQTELRL